MNIFQKIIADGRARQRKELVRFLRSYAVHAARSEDREAAQRALMKLGVLPGYWNDRGTFAYLHTRWLMGELYDPVLIQRMKDDVVRIMNDAALHGAQTRFFLEQSRSSVHPVQRGDEHLQRHYVTLPAPKKPFADRLYDRIMAFWERWLPDPDRPRKIIVGHMEVKFDWGDVPQSYRRTRELLNRITPEDAYLGRFPNRSDE